MSDSEAEGKNPGPPVPSQRSAAKDQQDASSENPDKSIDDQAEKATDDLTPEEQLARYEESLKNDDWGHQPC